MHLDYTLTPDDLREAAKPVKANGQPDRRRVGRGVLGWVVFLALALVLVYLLTLNPPPPGVRPPPPPMQNLWAAVVPGAVPSLALVLLMGVTLGVQWWQARRAGAAVAAGRPVPPANARALGQWSGLALIAPVALVLGWDVPAVAVHWTPTPTAAVWAGVAPWVVAVVVVFALGGWFNRGAAARLWAATPACRRPLAVDLSDAGIATADGVTDTLYRWAGVIRYRETDHLLVLTLEDARVLILPKRAVPDAPAEDRLRGLIQTHVAAGTFLPRTAAFPVLAAAPPPPVTV